MELKESNHYNAATRTIDTMAGAEDARIPYLAARAQALSTLALAEQVERVANLLDEMARMQAGL